MPHLVKDRVPHVHSDDEHVSSRCLRWTSMAVESLEILASITFVIGSACFLPRYKDSVNVLMLGCIMFIVGSVLFCIVCGVTLIEASAISTVKSYEIAEHGLYFLGSGLFLVGAVLYLPTETPEEIMKDGTTQDQVCTVGMNKLFLACLLFIIGSVFFMLASFMNYMFQQRSDDWSCRMLSTVTLLYMSGSFLFVVGSVAFLPQMGCGDAVLNVGAWCFIIGSVLFLIGAFIGWLRTRWLFQCEEAVPLAAFEGTQAPTAEEKGLSTH